MGFASTMKHPEGKLNVQVRTGWLRSQIALGFGAGGGVAIVVAVLELVTRAPDQGFALLKAWGPWALVVALAMLLAWKVASQAIGIVRVGVESFMQTSERAAIAGDRQADAMTKLADQGGRSHEEVRRLATYAAQEFPTVYLRLDQQDAMLRANHEASVQTHGMVKRLAEQMTEQLEASNRAKRGEG